MGEKSGQRASCLNEGGGRLLEGCRDGGRHDLVERDAACQDATTGDREPAVHLTSHKPITAAARGRREQTCARHQVVRSRKAGRQNSLGNDYHPCVTRESRRQAGRVDAVECSGYAHDGGAAA